MTNLEDKIIAYLDGMLDEQSRAELLHTLSVSPEKRKLLEEHIKLRELLALGHKPQSVPLMTERKLADRIPVLMQELPYLADKARYVAPLAGVNQTSYFTLLGRQVSNFFSSRFAPAVSLGTLAVVGGLTWYMMSSNGVQDQVSYAPSARQAESSQLDASPSLDQNPAAAGSSQTVTTEQSGTSLLSNRQQDGFFTENGIDYIVRNGKRYPIPVPETSEDLMIPDFSQREFESSDNFGEDVERNDASSQFKNDLAKTEAQSNGESSDAQNSSQHADAVNTNSEAASQNDIRDPEELMPPSVLDQPTITGRWVVQADVAGGATMRPNPKSQQYEAGSADIFLNFGAGYEFENGFTVGVEAGRSVLSQHQQEIERVQPDGDQGPMGSLISVNRRVNYTASVVDVDAYWSQATVRYTVNPGSVVPIEFSVGAGAAFVDGVSPLISLGVGSSLELSESVAIVFGGSMRGAWLDGLNADQGSDNGLVGNGEAVGVTHTAKTEEVFSSSLTARIGFRFGL